MIDLRSDTVTAPDEAMRDAMASAAVGDDVYGEDPTVNRLEARVSDVLGTDAALFCPSGTMANQIALDVWTDPGEELILEQDAHIYRYEVGGAARLAGLQTRPVDGGPRGVVTPDAVAAAMRAEALHVAGTGLLALENTHNRLGGRVHPPAVLADVAEVAREHDVPVHLDGARLWNASTATGDPPARFVAEVDSVMVSLSKGLGAPVGSVLAGDASFIDEARRTRKAFGGGMRQAGILAAAGLLALERRDDLARDHRLAQRLAAGLAELSGVDVTEPESNIVLVELGDVTADEWLAAAKEGGVGGSAMGEHTVRFVTHRDVDESAVDEALNTLQTVHHDVA